MSGARQFVIFSLVGLVNTAVHFCVFVVSFRAFSVPLLVASALGYCAGIVNSYVMNRLWTFKVKAGASTVEFLRFAAVNAVSLLVNLLALHVLVNSMNLMPEISQVTAILASLIVNFAGNKWWAFRASA